MHSYADRHTHDFFFERDYPDVKFLDHIYGRLRTEPQPREFFEKQSRVPPDVFEKALEKLWTHGGAIIDADDNLARGSAAWRDSYIAQGDQKQSQIEEMIRYAQSSQCRMSSLVRHFGDTADSRKPCGICDFCAPESCVAQQFRGATAHEQSVARDVMKALRMNRKSVGKLHTELCAGNGIDRDGFEELIGAMARAGLVRLEDSVFEKDGKQIPFRYASLAGGAGAPVELRIRETAAFSGKPRGKQSRRKKPAAAAKQRENLKGSAVEAKLKAWRRTVAAKQGVPAFRIMSDRVLLAIAEREPKTAAQLLAIPGIGIKMLEKYAAQIYRILD
jgi:superfamily II DNA helicase RecQ